MRAAASNEGNCHGQTTVYGSLTPQYNEDGLHITSASPDRLICCYSRMFFIMESRIKGAQIGITFLNQLDVEYHSTI